MIFKVILLVFHKSPQEKIRFLYIKKDKKC